MFWKSKAISEEAKAWAKLLEDNPSNWFRQGEYMKLKDSKVAIFIGYTEGIRLKGMSLYHWTRKERLLIEHAVDKCLLKQAASYIDKVPNTPMTRTSG